MSSNEDFYEEPQQLHLGSDGAAMVTGAEDNLAVPAQREGHGQGEADGQEEPYADFGSDTAHNGASRSGGGGSGSSAAHSDRGLGDEVEGEEFVDGAAEEAAPRQELQPEEIQAGMPLTQTEEPLRAADLDAAQSPEVAGESGPVPQQDEPAAMQEPPVAPVEPPSSTQFMKAKPPQQQRQVATLHRSQSPMSGVASMPPYMAVSGEGGGYEMPESERIAVAAASLTPNTVLAVFRRGQENSHVNRMVIGSYSRYLLSTDHMPPVVLDDTFHGEETTVGTAPRNTMQASGRGTVNGSSPMDSMLNPATTEQRHRVGTALASSARRAYQHPHSASANTDGHTGSPGFNDTGASSLNLREIEMLDEATLTDLNVVRQQRRRDPRHGKAAGEQQDYVYYNHRGKGCYVPHDPPAETVMLQYNHLYGFGDGTRFAPLNAQQENQGDGAAAQLHGVTLTKTMNTRNPHAAPPRTFAESRGSAFPYTASQRGCGSSGVSPAQTRSVAKSSVANSSAGSMGLSHRRQRADIEKGSSSLRTATAIDLGRLHSTQCPRPRTIEEVVADQPQRYLCGPEGCRGALAQDIERDIEDGKLQWEEVPPAMKKALAAAATTAAASAQRTQLSSAAEAQAASNFAKSGRPLRRIASLSMPPNTLKEVMGQVRPVPAIVAAANRGGSASKMVPTAPPSPVAGAAAARSQIERQNSNAAGGSSCRLQAGQSAAAAALPAISRLNYTKRPTMQSNPSAFV